MKLGTKIFCFVTIFFSVAFLTGGYFLLSFFCENVMEREVENAAREYQYNKFVVEAAFLTQGEEWFQGVAAGAYDIGRITSDMSGATAFYREDGTELYSGFPKGTDMGGVLSEAETDRVKYRFMEIGERRYLLVFGKLSRKDTVLCMITGTDVEELWRQQEQMVHWFGLVYGGVITVGMLLILGLSLFLTGPLKRLAAATRSVAQGNYDERIRIAGRDEVGELARDFRQMQSAVEEKVQELTRNAEEKEDFVANFAHELKTPLTSIIGYADRIYRKELPREEQRKAAWYIWNEGMRLEALSYKLMDLTNLNRGDFVLAQMRADLLLQDLAQKVELLAEERQAKILTEAQRGFIRIEYDLFQTLFLNLVDNALKAGADRIVVTGRVREGFYRIQVEDNGVGIPEEERQRITEAFYMVDKSRSRKQHGAGLGLAIAQRIAEVHGSSLRFEAGAEKGTRVFLDLKRIEE